MDADFAVVNDTATFEVTESIIQHRHKITPYLGNTLYGVVKCTYLHGEKVYGEGEFPAANRGQLLSRE
jgi:allantoinase